MKLIYLVVLCFGATITAFGQVKSITKERYDAARENAHSATDAILRRVITETTTYKASKIDSTKTLTIESFPNGDARWNSATKRDGQVIDKFQLVYLGKYEYRKEGDTDWKKRCVKDCSESEMGGGMGFGGTELPKVQEFLVSDTSIGGQTVTMYLFYRVYQFGTILNFYQGKTWIGSNGLIQREESVTRDVFPANVTSLETISYEYNPKDIVPLEAPIK